MLAIVVINSDFEKAIMNGGVVHWDNRKSSVNRLFQSVFLPNFRNEVADCEYIADSAEVESPSLMQCIVKSKSILPTDVSSGLAMLMSGRLHA